MWIPCKNLLKGAFPMFAQKSATLIVEADCSRFNQHFLQCLSNISLIWIIQTFFPSEFWCFTFSSFDINSEVFFSSKNEFGKTSIISLCNLSNMLLKKMDERWVKISRLENYVIIISIFYFVSSNRRSRCHPSLMWEKLFGSL